MILLYFLFLLPADLLAYMKISTDLKVNIIEFIAFGVLMALVEWFLGDSKFFIAGFLLARIQGLGRR